MHYFLPSEQIVSLGCCLLYCIVEDTQGCLGFLEADGISILSSIMQQHSYSPKIQEHACWVIDALVRANRDYVPLLLQDNCIEAMIHSLRTHASVDSLVDWVLKATHAMMLVSTQVHVSSNLYQVAMQFEILFANDLLRSFKKKKKGNVSPQLLQW